MPDTPLTPADLGDPSASVAVQIARDAMGLQEDRT